MCECVSAQAAIENEGLGDLNNGNAVSHSLEGKKSKFKVLAYSVPGW